MTETEACCSITNAMASLSLVTENMPIKHRFLICRGNCSFHLEVKNVCFNISKVRISKNPQKRIQQSLCVVGMLWRDKGN